MVAPIVREFLERSHARFTETAHPRVTTALGEAQKDHTRASELIKTVVVRAGGRYALAALPSNTKIDWESLKTALGGGEVMLAAEGELDRLFPDVETGAVPPLGPIFDLPVYLDSRLAEREQIAFNAGSHTNTIHMSFAQFRRLVEPRICSFAVPEH